MSDHITRFGPHTNYKIPPESSGSSIQHYEHWFLEVQNLSGNFGFPASFSTISGVTGTVSSYWVTGLGGQARVLVMLDVDSEDITELVAAEVITINDTTGTQTANLISWAAVLTPVASIVDATNPLQAAKIDSSGALSTRFTEGEPQFDAFGLIRMAMPTRLVDYEFVYDKLPNEFHLSSTGTGTVTHLPNEASIALDVGAGATDAVSYTTHAYTSYTPGVSQLIVMTVAVGDEGKDDVVRRWGYYDDNNGVFFELEGTELFVVKRSSTSGTPVDTRIARQSWSGDQLTGDSGNNNSSGMLLDLSKVNIFWLDLQWLGGGKIRYGIFTPDGKRIQCHSMLNANANSTPYMATASLPIRYEQYNTDNTASPSRLKATCAAVFSEGTNSPDTEKNKIVTRSATLPSVLVDDTETLLAVFKVSDTFLGKTNRKKTIPKTLHYYNSGPHSVAITIRFNSIAAISGGTYVQPHADSPAMYNVTATELVPGTQVSQRFLNSGATTHSVTADFNSQAYYLKTQANGVATIVATVSAKCLSAGNTVNVTLGVDWSDL